MIVLIEGKASSRSGYLMGHTENFLPVLVPEHPFKQNDLVQVRLTANDPEGLVGVYDN